MLVPAHGKCYLFYCNITFVALFIFTEDKLWFIAQSVHIHKTCDYWTRVKLYFLLKPTSKIGLHILNPAFLMPRGGLVATIASNFWKMFSTFLSNLAYRYISLQGDFAVSWEEFLHLSNILVSILLSSFLTGKYFPLQQNTILCNENGQIKKDAQMSREPHKCPSICQVQNNF